MKKLILLLMLLFGIYSINIKSQTVSTMDSNPGHVLNPNSTINKTSGKGIVINFEMIERFNNIASDGEYLTWRDLILGYDIQSLRDFYYAYNNSDMEYESLNDIKLALEEKRLNHENSIKDSDTEYFAKIMNRNIEINTADTRKMFVQKLY